jgi:transposase-like protein
MIRHAPLTQAEKEIIREKKAQGESLAKISLELGCSKETVKKWWRSIRAEQHMNPPGRPKKGACSTYPEPVYTRSIEMKRKHPHWGPKKVIAELKQEPNLGGQALPSPATLSILFKERCPEAVQVHKPRHLPPSDPQVWYVHQRWQMDAKEGIRIGSVRANVQEIRDVFSGLMIASQAFEAGACEHGWQHLHREDHQQTLRQAFSEWGLPLEVQTDHDVTFVNSSDPGFPTLFTLWLVGLGLVHILSRPKRPTDQAQIERNHRTQGDFVWKDQTFEQISALQQALDYHRHSYNAYYPSQAKHCHGLPALSVFPTAHSTGRPYHPDLEWDLFDLSRVDAFLAQQVWTRKVASNRTVFLGGQYYSLAKEWKSLLISIRFSPLTRAFHFQSADGSLSLDLPVRGLDKEHILGLIPAHVPLPAGFQFAFPFMGV